MLSKTRAKREELVKIIEELNKLMTPAIADASSTAKKYSEDLQSSLAFEVGYLGGIIKEALRLIDEIK